MPSFDSGGRLYGMCGSAPATVISSAKPDLRIASAARRPAIPVPHHNDAHRPPLQTHSTVIACSGRRPPPPHVAAQRLVESTGRAQVLATSRRNGNVPSSRLNSARPLRQRLPPSRRPRPAGPGRGG